MTISRNRLTQQQSNNLCMYLASNKERLEGRSPDELQQLIEIEIGLVVNKNNLKSISKVDGLQWVMPEPKKRPSKQEAEKILARSLADIYRMLNEPVPEDLAALAGEGDV